MSTNETISRGDKIATPKRRYEPPRLLFASEDARDTEKSVASPVDHTAILHYGS